ncbi:TPR repeat-containing protein [Escherichia coli]|uniref:TPR repeat-containing protein n=1 Tax=Escherichia coli TaxID=562 RepID=A0A376UCN9_ECOLX|nr:TPR repeat-containing protein [Escherichia coli]
MPKIDLIDNTILFSAMAEGPTFSRIAAGGGFICHQCQFADREAFLDMQDDNLPKLVVASLYPLCRA